MHREMISPVEQMRAKYKKRRKEAGTREDSTMAKLAAFTADSSRHVCSMVGAADVVIGAPCAHLWVRRRGPPAAQRLRLPCSCMLV